MAGVSEGSICTVYGRCTIPAGVVLRKVHLWVSLLWVSLLTFCMYIYTGVSLIHAVELSVIISHSVQYRRIIPFFYAYISVLK